MKKLTIFAGVFMLALLFVSAVKTNAQTRKSISAAEANGTFRSFFRGRFKDSANEIKIFAIGKNRLKISFSLIYPYVMSSGELSANIGEAAGEASIAGDTAVYSSNEAGNCKITIKFVKPGLIKVTQESPGTECDFGHNVTADGTYKKTRRAKPKF